MVAPDECLSPWGLRAPSEDFRTGSEGSWSCSEDELLAPEATPPHLKKHRKGWWQGEAQASVTGLLMQQFVDDERCPSCRGELFVGLACDGERCSYCRAGCSDQDPCMRCPCGAIVCCDLPDEAEAKARAQLSVLGFLRPGFPASMAPALRLALEAACKPPEKRLAIEAPLAEAAEHALRHLQRQAREDEAAQLERLQVCDRSCSPEAEAELQREDARLDAKVLDLQERLKRAQPKAKAGAKAAAGERKQLEKLLALLEADKPKKKDDAALKKELLKLGCAACCVAAVPASRGSSGRFEQLVLAEARRVVTERAQPGEDAGALKEALAAAQAEKKEHQKLQRQQLAATRQRQQVQKQLVRAQKRAKMADEADEGFALACG